MSRHFCAAVACLVFQVVLLGSGGFAVAAHDHHHHHHHGKTTSEAADAELSEESLSKRNLLLGVYCVMIVAASFVGGWLPSRIQLTHTRMQTLISFVGGLMLGIGLLHLLPHSIHELGSPDQAVYWMIGGVVLMFLLIRAFHVHHHGPVELEAEQKTVVEDSYQYREHDHDHDHDHDSSSHGSSSHGHSHHAHKLSWVGIAFGLSLHTLIDGIALGAHVSADAGHDVLLSLFGLGTFLGVLLHKPLDAISITTLMAAGGWSPRSRQLVNLGFAMMCPAGALLFVFGVGQFADHQQIIVGSALAFAAGVFLCISLGDLLPEMEFHSHHRVRLTIALLLGIALAYGITFLEPEHMHN